jgi:hypothetical protein
VLLAAKSIINNCSVAASEHLKFTLTFDAHGTSILDFSVKRERVSLTLKNMFKEPLLVVFKHAPNISHCQMVVRSGLIFQRHHVAPSSTMCRTAITDVADVLYPV